LVIPRNIPEIIYIMQCQGIMAVNTVLIKTIIPENFIIFNLNTSMQLDICCEDINFQIFTL